MHEMSVQVNQYTICSSSVVVCFTFINLSKLELKQRQIKTVFVKKIHSCVIPINQDVFRIVLYFSLRFHAHNQMHHESAM